MNGTVVNCLLLTIPGYNHSEKYRKKWEGRDDDWRLVTEHRWTLPLLAGYVVRKDGTKEPAVIALTFTPKNSTKIVALQNVISFFQDPLNSPWRFRTIVLSRIAGLDTNPKAVDVVPLSLADKAAARFCEIARQRLVGPPPENFEVAANLLDYMFSQDPKELLRVIGLIKDEEEEEEDEVYEDTEDDYYEHDEDDEWDTEDDSDNEEEDWGSGRDYAPSDERIDEDRGTYTRDSWEDEDETEAEERWEEDTESEREWGEAEESAPPPPPPVSPRPDAEKADGGANSIADTIARLYRPDKGLLRQVYGIEDEEKEEESSVKKLISQIPPWPHIVACVLISLASYFVPQISLVYFLLIGGRAGLRIFLGTLFLQALYFLYNAGLGIRQWYVYALVGIIGLSLYYMGMQKLYARYSLRFELATSVKKVGSAIKQVYKKPQESAGMIGAVAIKETRSENWWGAIPDLLFLLLPFAFVYPPLHPIAVGIAGLLWHVERKKPAVWSLGIVAHTIADLFVKDIPTKTLVFLWFLRLISYINIRTAHDITPQSLRNWPTAIRDFFRLLIASPAGALKFLWSGKKVRVHKEVVFDVPEVDEKVAQLINDLPQNVLAGILSGLTPEQHKAWMTAAEKAGTVVPIIATPVPEAKKFYHAVYQLRVAPVVSGDPIHPEVGGRMMTGVAQALAQKKKIIIGSEGQLELPRVCRVSIQENPECILKELPPPVILGKTGAIVPVGTSYIYYTRGRKHYHYATGIIYDPDYSGHLLIVAPSGSGKSVLMRALMNGLAQAAEKVPIRLLYAEGKSELAGSGVRIEPFLTPFIYLSDGTKVLNWLVAVRAIMDTRQAFHAALGKYLGDSAPPKELLVRRYGHGFPMLVVIFDEYFAASMQVQELKTLSAEDKDGKAIKVSAPQFFISSLGRIVTLSRSMGIALTLSTQTGRAEAVYFGLRENCTMAAGKIAGISPQLVNVLLGGSANSMKQIAFQLTGNTNAHLPGLHAFGFSEPKGATIAWITHDGEWIVSGNAKLFPEEPPAWDVVLPYFYSTINPAKQLCPVNREAIEQDIAVLLDRGLLSEQPVCGWMKALGIDPFESAEEFMEFGKSVLTKYVLQADTQLAAKE